MPHDQNTDVNLTEIAAHQPGGPEHLGRDARLVSTSTLANGGRPGAEVDSDFLDVTFERARRQPFVLPHYANVYVVYSSVHNSR